VLVISADAWVFLSMLRQFVPIHLSRLAHYELRNWRGYLRLTGKGKVRRPLQLILQIKANVAGWRIQLLLPAPSRGTHDEKR